MQYGSKSARAIAASCLCLAIAACGVPAEQATQRLRTVSDLGGTSQLAGDAAQFPDYNWWTVYKDPALDALIADGLANSPDMAVAAARIRAADATARQVGAAAMPQLGIEGSAGGNKQSYNQGIPPQFVPHGITDVGKLSATLSLDLDLWGRNRAQLAAARGEATAARVDAAQARLLLATGIALSWGQLAAFENSRTQTQASLEALAGIERLTAERRRAGLDNLADQSLATARRAATEQALAALDESIALERNRLAALVGAGPDRARALPHPNPDFTAATGVPANLGLDLVGRRPDLVSARLRAEAGASRVKAARLAYFPDINLAAVAGLQSLGLSNLFSGDSSFAQFGPAVSLPIFAGGRLRGQYDAAAAGRDEAVARYDQALIGAVHEVADALDGKRALVTRLAAARTGAQAAAEAARLAQLRYDQGLANLIQVLAAEDSAASARRNLAELQVRAFILDVTLVRALGGGFAPSAPVPEQSRK